MSLTHAFSKCRSSDPLWHNWSFVGVLGECEKTQHFFTWKSQKEPWKDKPNIHQMDEHVIDYRLNINMWERLQFCFYHKLEAQPSAFGCFSFGRPTIRFGRWHQLGSALGRSHWDLALEWKCKGQHLAPTGTFSGWCPLVWPLTSTCYVRKVSQWTVLLAQVSSAIEFWAGPHSNGWF